MSSMAQRNEQQQKAEQFSFGKYLNTDMKQKEQQMQRNAKFEGHVQVLADERKMQESS